MRAFPFVVLTQAWRIPEASAEPEPALAATVPVTAMLSAPAAKAATTVRVGRRSRGSATVLMNGGRPMWSLPRVGARGASGARSTARRL